MHGPTLRARAPYTFFLPHHSLIEAVRVGDLAKVGFDYDPPGEKYDAERMWVHVDQIEGPQYTGHLVNEPNEPKPIVKYGDEVTFTRDNILDVLLVDQTRFPAFEEDQGRYPKLPKERQYWTRCLVDDCVLYDGIPVEYIYREDSEELENDRYPDSGWRIRGRQGDATDEEMDQRKASMVALGAVLNEDDSWLHLIDEPVGSAFKRNFGTGAYEEVN